MHTHTHLTNMNFVYYANNHFMGLFYEFCTFIRHYWKKINIHCELVTSQPHWFSGSQLDISNFQLIFNNFLIYCLICMKFAPNSLVLEILWLWLGFNVSDASPLRMLSSKCLAENDVKKYILTSCMSRLMAEISVGYHGLGFSSEKTR